jgi:hypothetical protein
MEEYMNGRGDREAAPQRIHSPVSALFAVALSLIAFVVFAPAAGAASGDLAWQRVINGSGDGNDFFVSVAPAPNGGVYAAGTTFAATSDVLAVRYDAAGQRLWLRTYNGPANGVDGASAAAADGSGNLVVAGSANAALIVIAAPVASNAGCVSTMIR